MAYACRKKMSAARVKSKPLRGSPCKMPDKYQNEVRKRQILEKKSTREVQKRDAELAEKTERIRKLEQEMISLQRTAPSRTRAFLGLDE